jgi:hypothetical protein
VSAKRRLERILRDEDDASAQTVRRWLLTAADGHLQIASNENSDWIMIRLSDVPQLVADLQEIARDCDRPPQPR